MLPARDQLFDEVDVLPEFAAAGLTLSDVQAWQPDMEHLHINPRCIVKLVLQVLKLWLEKCDTYRGRARHDSSSTLIRSAIRITLPTFHEKFSLDCDISISK